MKKTFLAFALFASTLQGQIHLPQHTVRVSLIYPVDPHSDWTGISPAFLDRAKQNGFNYILPIFELTTTYWNVNGSYKPKLVDDLKTVLLAADSRGLKVIPHFQFGTKHASPGLDAINTNILWNIIGHGDCQVSGRAKCLGSLNYTHSYTPDEPGMDGVDYIFGELMLGIRAAYDAADLPHPEYIHIGHDEPLGGYGVHPLDPPGTPPHGLLDTLMAGNSPTDSIFLSANISGPSREATEEAFQLLLASELERRIQQMGNVFGSGTNLMVWGDMYDNQHAGGELRPQLFNNHWIRTEGTLDKIPSGLRSRLVIVPWIYQTNYPYGLPESQSDYNTDSTFSAIKSRNYKFMYGIQAGHDGDTSAPFSVTAGPGLRQLSEFVTTADKPSHRSNARGFISAHFAGYPNGPHFARNDYRWAWHSPPWNFRTMEFLSLWAVYSAAIFD